MIKKALFYFLVFFLGAGELAVSAKEPSNIQVSCKGKDSSLNIFNLELNKTTNWADLERQAKSKCGLGRLLLRGGHPSGSISVMSIKNLPHLLYFIPLWEDGASASQEEMLIQSNIPTERDFLLLAGLVHYIGMMDFERAQEKYDALHDYVRNFQSIQDIYVFMKAHQTPTKEDSDGVYSALLLKHYCWGASEKDPLPFVIHEGQTWQEIEYAAIRTHGPGRLFVQDQSPLKDTVPSKNEIIKNQPLDFKTICPTSEVGYVNLSVISRLLAQGNKDRARTCLLDDYSFKEDEFFQKIQEFLKINPYQENASKFFNNILDQQEDILVGIYRKNMLKKSHRDH